MILHAWCTTILLVVAAHLSNLKRDNEPYDIANSNRINNIRKTYSASIARLSRSRGRVDLFLDILGVIGRRILLLSLDDFDIIERGRIIVCLSLHDCPRP
jgi:hypothetical protein